MYVERYNFDLIEGMTNMTYTPPARKNRRRRYEDRVKYGLELQESAVRTSGLGCQTDEESPNPEQTVESGTVGDDEYIPTHRDNKDTYGPYELTGLTGCEADSSSSELSEIVDRPVTELVKARSGIKTDFPSEGHSELVDRPVTESVTARDGSDTNFPSSKHSELVDRPVTESVTTQAGIDTDFSSDKESDIVDRPVTESVMARSGIETDFQVMNIQR